MALFRKPHPGDATEATATSSDWQKTLETLTRKLTESEQALKEVEAERDRKALELALGDPQMQTAALADYAARIAELSRAIDNTQSALAHAQQRLRTAEERERAAAEVQRLDQVARLWRKYLDAVQRVDSAMGALAAAFDDSRQLLNAINNVQNADERARTHLLRSPVGPTIAAHYAGLGQYLDFTGTVVRRPPYKPLIDFTNGLVAPPGPRPIDSNVCTSESEALSQPHLGKAN